MKTIGTMLVAGALTFGVACEQMEQGGERAGEGLERGAETAGRDTREAFRDLGDEMREGGEAVDRELHE